MVWHNIDRIFYSIIDLQTVWGKLWYHHMIFMRLFTIHVIGSELYEDEQAEFRCDTVQPGCHNVCYNAFSPMSQIRFWAVQCLICVVPVFVFHSYALAKFCFPDRRPWLDKNRGRDGDDGSSQTQASTTDPEKTSLKRQKGGAASVSLRNRKKVNLMNQNDLPPKSPSTIGTGTESSSEAYINMVDDNDDFMGRYDTMCHSHQVDKYMAQRELTMPILPIKELVKNGPNRVDFYKFPIIEQIKVRAAYAACCLAKLATEILFLYLGYHLQYQMSRKTSFFECFTVPERYLCLHGREFGVHTNSPEMSPCSQQEEVSCWVSRPKEKEYFLRYMLFCQFVSIALIVIDFFHTCGKIWVLFRNK